MYKKVWGKVESENADSLCMQDLDSEDCFCENDSMPEFVPPKFKENKSSVEKLKQTDSINSTNESISIDSVSPKHVSEPMRSPSFTEDVSSTTQNSLDTSCLELKNVEEFPKSEKKKKQEKRSLTDKELWTILLTPDFDSKAFRAFKKLLGGMLCLFRIRFKNCYVEGVRMRYDCMGYGASINVFLKSYPWVGDWDIRMDWTMDKELKIAGEVIGKINLCRFFHFLFLLVLHGFVLGISFFRRRRYVLRTNKLPELSLLRKKLVEWMVE